MEAVFSSPVKAVTCGSAGTLGECGSKGGCSSNTYICRIGDFGPECAYDSIGCSVPVTPTISPSTTPTVSPTPTTSPIPTPSVPIPTISIPPTIKACPDDDTIYPPNSECYAETKRTQTEIDNYPKTCIKEPTVSYEDIRNITGQYGYANCFEKDGGDCDIYITVTTDLSKAELGSYGPNYETLITASADSMSKKYLFNALFDRPSFSIPETPRETWRTYWRLLPTNEQFNLVAQFMKMVNLNTLLDISTLQRVNNTKWQYLDKNLDVHETTIKQLSDSLPKCLKTEPVCPDFAQVYNDLPDNTKAAYDTILPLSLNNLRGFIALMPPAGVSGGGQVVRESQPYIETIFQGLLSSKYGLIGNLQPSWLFKKSQTGLTDPNTSYDLSAGKGNYISGQFGTINFDDKSLNAPVLDKADIIQCSDYPNVYSLSAPRTFPKNPDNTDGSITQDIKILGSTLKWKVKTSPASYECVRSEYQYINRQWVLVCLEYDYVCTSPPDNCSEPPFNGADDKCCQFKVTGSGKGKALTVFNNPKTTDIKDSVTGNKESALYDSLIPLSLLTPTPIDKKISAPAASNTLINTKNTGTGVLTLQGSSIIRENNLAQDTMHLLQNCWLVPSNQQSSSKCGKANVTPPPNFTCPTDCDKNIPSAATAMALKPKFSEIANAYVGGLGHALLEKYDTVVNSAVAAGVNPLFALTIWLNESAVSNYEGVCLFLGKGDLTSGYCTHLLDFGINLDAIASNWAEKKFFFDEQLQNFLLLPNYYKTVCKEEMEKYQCPMRIFMAMFRDGTCEPSAGSDAYLDSKITIFSWFAPNEKFPCYPSAYP